MGVVDFDAAPRAAAAQRLCASLLTAVVVLTPAHARAWAEGLISDNPQVAIATVHAVLEMVPAAEPLIPELYDYFVILSQRAATGEIPPRWAAYLYTNYFRDLVRDRPNGRPRRTLAELHASLDADIDFYFIRKRPDVGPAPFGSWVWEAAIPHVQGP